MLATHRYLGFDLVVPKTSRWVGIRSANYTKVLNSICSTGCGRITRPTGTSGDRWLDGLGESGVKRYKVCSCL